MLLAGRRQCLGVRPGTHQHQQTFFQQQAAHSFHSGALDRVRAPIRRRSQRRSLHITLVAATEERIQTKWVL